MKLVVAYPRASPRAEGKVKVR